MLSATSHSELEFLTKFLNMSKLENCCTRESRYIFLKIQLQISKKLTGPFGDIEKFSEKDHKAKKGAGKVS